MSRRKKVTVVTVVASLFFGYGYGLLSYKFDLFPVPALRLIYNYGTDTRIATVGYEDVSDRVEIDCAMLPENTAVLLVLGQSNSANHGESRHRPRETFYNFNFLDGKCYQATDPLLGATGAGGSVWSRLGDLAIGRGVFSNLIIAPIGVNASSITRWLNDGDLYNRISSTLEQLRKIKLEPTHVLWHQGEADAMQKMDGDTYYAALQSLIRNFRTLNVRAPIFVSITSMCHNSGSDAIRNAQRKVSNLTDNVYPGANTDQLDSLRLRYDGCHFSGDGLQQHALLWIDILQAMEN
jgi:carbohydrate esterase-like sialic acid-specific acetylesterase